MRDRSENEMLNVGLELSLEWGENWFKPIQERLQKRFPDMGREEADRLDAACREIQNYCWDDLCCKELDREMSMSDMRLALLERFPEISSSNVSKLISQGMYYVRK